MSSYAWNRITGSGIISKTPGYIGCVIATPDSNTKPYIIIYDGESADDPVITTIRGRQGESKVVRFQPPLKTQRGLYIYLHSDTKEVLIQHSWGPE